MSSGAACTQPLPLPRRLSPLPAAPRCLRGASLTLLYLVECFCSRLSHHFVLVASASFVPAFSPLGISAAWQRSLEKKENSGASCGQWHSRVPPEPCECSGTCF